MKKRISLSDLRRADEAQDACFVRDLEMTLDSVLTSPGYSIQFWRDAQTYGIDEAILYVENGKHASPSGVEEIKETWQRIKAKIS